MISITRVFVLGAAIFTLQTGCHTPHRSPAVEYKVVQLTWGDNKSPDAELNALAKQGWRVQDSQMSYTPHVHTGVFLLRRSE